METSPVWWPTLEQQAGAAVQARRRAWLVAWEISYSLGIVASLPLVAGWQVAELLHRHNATWWLAVPMGLVIAAVGAWTGWQLLIQWPGQPLRPEDQQEFHLAKSPLRPSQWKEIETILQCHPESVSHARAWSKAWNGTLVLAHLWELRRRHTSAHFVLGVVETNGAVDRRGRNVDAWHYHHPNIALPTDISMILEGALLGSEPGHGAL